MSNSRSVVSSKVALLVVLLVTVFIFCGCSSTTTSDNKSASSTDVASTLTKTVSKNGVSFSIASSWKSDLSSKYGGVEPSSNNKITVTTFTGGESASLTAVEESGAGLLGKAEEYELEKTWGIAEGTQISSYTFSGNYIYSVALGHNSDSNTGFLIFFNRGEKDNMGNLDDDTYNAILDTIAFEPTEAVAFVSSTSDANSSTSSETTDVENPSSDSSQSSPTTSQTNALSKAKSYLSISFFSESGLKDQLEYEQFSSEDAEYAVANCRADWNAQALGKAKQYLNTSSFSSSGLIDQLIYEGFTSDQAQYGVENCGADWMDQAAKKAKSYMDISSFSRDGLIDQLEYEGFTAEQATFGADSVGL